jgi:hypothetical protein
MDGAVAAAATPVPEAAPSRLEKHGADQDEDSPADQYSEQNRKGARFHAPSVSWIGLRVTESLAREKKVDPRSSPG